MTKRLTMTIFSLATVLFMAAPVQAATVYCPGTAGTGDREFGVEVTFGTGTASCLTSGSGNEPGGFDGYTYIDKDESPDQASAPGINEAWFTLNNLGTLGGTFTIDGAIWGLYNSLILVFKSGTANGDPDWVAFLLTPEVLGGNWSIIDPAGAGVQSLSHASLYGAATPTVVPEPASMFLFGTGLMGVAQAVRKRLRGRRA